MLIRKIFFVGLTIFILLLGDLVSLDFIGTRPNLLLVILVLLGIVISRPGLFLTMATLITVLGANVFLFRWEVAMLFLLTGLIFLVKNRLPWRPGIVFLVFVFTATGAVYLLADPVFLISHSAAVIREALYNGFIGAVLYYIFSRFIVVRLLADRMVP